MTNPTRSFIKMEKLTNGIFQGIKLALFFMRTYSNFPIIGFTRLNQQSKKGPINLCIQKLFLICAGTHQNIFHFKICIHVESDQ